MGSVGFTSNCKKKHKLSRKILNDCITVNYASVPKKLRSAIKKRRRELITQPLPILSGKHHVSNGVATPKNRAKKSKLNMKKRYISKDEKEVAETLYALADMFSDATKTSEPSETKSSTVIQTGNSATAAEDTENLTKRVDAKKIGKKVAIEAASYSSNLVDSTSQFVKVESLNDASDLAFDKQSDFPVTQSDLRQKMSSLDMIPSGELAVAPTQVATPCVHYGKRNFYPTEDRSFGTYQSPSSRPSRDLSSRDLSSKTQGSSPQLPAWLKTAICTSKPLEIGNSIILDKNSHAAIESKASRKRCSAHVYISLLIKVLQISNGSEGLPEKPSQLTTCRGTEIGLNGRNGIVFSNGITNSGTEKNSSEIQNAILLHKRLLQDQQLPLNTPVVCSSTKQGSDRQLDDSAGINGAWNNHEDVKRLHASFLQSQNPFLQSHNSYSTNFHGYTSAAEAQQVQHPPFRFNSLERNVTEPFQQQFGSQHQKWPFQIQDQYNSRGVAAIPYLAEWQNGGRHSSLQLNYAQYVYPHMYSAIGSNYQPVSPPQHFTSSQLHKNWFSATPTYL